jgi:hypothetical protein
MVLIDRAYIAQDHERGRAGIPAFPDIGTISTGAYGMEMLILNQVLNPGIFLPPGHFHPEPSGQTTLRSQFFHLIHSPSIILNRTLIGPQNYKKNTDSGRSADKISLTCCVSSSREKIIR